MIRWEARFVDGPAKAVAMTVLSDPVGLPPFTVHLPPVSQFLGRSMMHQLPGEPGENTTPYNLVGMDRDKLIARYSIGAEDAVPSFVATFTNGPSQGLSRRVTANDDGKPPLVLEEPDPAKPGWVTVYWLLLYHSTERYAEYRQLFGQATR